jgi:hypothetical protein
MLKEVILLQSMLRVWSNRRELLSGSVSELVLSHLIGGLHNGRCVDNGGGRNSYLFPRSADVARQKNKSSDILRRASYSITPLAQLCKPAQLEEEDSVRLLRIVLFAGGLVSSERGRKIPQPVDRGGNNKMQMHRRDHMGRKKSVGQMERHCHVCRKSSTY